MPTFHEENLVMWRGYAHLISLMDLLRLRTAGWVAESTDRPDLHLGLVHATQEYATPADAARHLDMQAAIARQKREAERARRGGDVWMHAEPRDRRPADETPGRVTTTRARNASRRSRSRT
ncbi:hypothetical protein LRS13_24300 [Svornostia abyssi]|uniref:Uncharacterized protein n=1 Tax=Svornostia abyssi TaxID=2898438 RepID=A0ABY5PGC9_9ACTN|nr:hypothetical protein LRS13_24300 [Parviterribacteraceae bacterium J379]